MPLGIIGGAAIGAGLNIAQNFANGFTQEYFNKRQHATQIADYQMMRQDALNDWQRDANYNSPAAMVQRLKDANISPYALAGSSFVASQPTNKSPNSVGSTQPYQVNNATSLFGTLQGIEQVKAMRLDNQKREVDIEVQKQELQSRQTNNQTLGERNRLEVQNMAKQLAVSDASIDEKRAHVDNLKQQLKQQLVDYRLSKIKELYESDFLRGRNTLQQVETDRRVLQMRQISAEIDRLNIHNQQDVKMFPYKVAQIQAQIYGNQLSNTAKKLENAYLPTFLGQKEVSGDIQNATNTEQLEYLRTLTPQQRFWLDKLGGLGGDILKGAARGFMKK